MEGKAIIKKIRWQRILRVFLRIFAVIVAFMLAVILVLNIPAVQNWVAGKITKTIREKTGVEFRLESIRVAFPKTIRAEGLFLRDQNFDTLLYLNSLRVNVDLLMLIRKEIRVNSLRLNGLVANIHRKSPQMDFNYQFLVDALTSADTVKPPVIETVNQPSSWQISVSKLRLENFHISFADEKENINAGLELGELEIQVNDLDLDKHLIDIDEILFSENTAWLILPNPAGEDVALSGNNSENQGEFEGGHEQAITGLYPGWDISVGRLCIENTGFRFDRSGSTKLDKGFDWDHFAFDGLTADISDILLNANGIGAGVDEFSVHESCGFVLNRFIAELQLTEKQAIVKDLSLETALSKITVDARMDFASLRELAHHPENTSISLDLKETIISPDDVFVFVPSLKEIPILEKLSKKELSITTKADGKISDLNIEELALSLDEDIVFSTNGKISGLPDIYKSYIDAAFRLSSKKTDRIYRLLDIDGIAGLKLPAKASFEGLVKGNIDSVFTDITLTTPIGTVSATGYYQKPVESKNDTLTIAFTGKDILPGTVLGDTTFGKISFSGTASASGLSIGNLYGTMNLQIEEALYLGYSYRDIEIKGIANQETYSISVISNDPNIAFTLDADANLQHPVREFSTKLDISNLNLFALHFYQDTVAISSNLLGRLDASGIDHAEMTLNLENTLIKTNDVTIPVRNFSLNATSLPDSLMVNVNTDLADGLIHGNINANQLLDLIKIAFKKYLGQEDSSAILTGKHLVFTIDAHPPAELTGLLVPGLEELKVTQMDGKYSSDGNDLFLNIEVPKAVYYNAVIDSLKIDATGSGEDLSVTCMISQIAYDSLRVCRIKINELVDGGKITSAFMILDTLNEPHYMLSNAIDLAENGWKISFVPGGLILDGKAWQIEKDNYLVFDDNRFAANRFVFSSGEQSVGLVTEEQSMQIVIEKFGLQNLLNAIESQDFIPPVKGMLDGKVIIPNDGRSDFIDVDLVVEQLTLADTLVGNLVLNIHQESDKLSLEAGLDNEQNSLKMSGDISYLSEKPVLDLGVLIDFGNLQYLKQFSYGYLSELNGSLNGEMTVKGEAVSPMIEGLLNFRNTGFTLSDIDFSAQINDQKVVFQNQKVRFDDFTIEDNRNKKLVVDGDITIKDLSRPAFDLRLSTENFQALNTAKGDNSLVFGKLLLNTTANLKGTPDTLHVETDIRINKETDLTYVLPGSELKLVTSEGTVQFISPEQNIDSVTSERLTDYLSDSLIRSYSGNMNMDLSVNLEIDPDAKFTVNIDPKSGDFLTIGGTAKLNITVDPTGNQSITGIYEVKSGLYQLSFYGLVKKSFTIMPGSRIAFSGDPLDAEIDITAENIIRTSSVALVANETTSMSEAEKNIFKQRLPYAVRLNIRGFLTKPEISFNITLPEKELLNYPLVATKLASLNTEEMASELNKQVFALLVTGSFIADNPLESASGSSPTDMASTAARNSVNGILADQMNNLSGKYISNFDVNFGLTTYEDFASGSSEMRTELDVQVSKKLFSDRLTVEAQGTFGLDEKKNTGPQSENMYGEFAVTYSLTESGEYKLRTYYENAYDLFDGEITMSGISFIFEKEFDTLKNRKNKNKEAGRKHKPADVNKEGLKSNEPEPERD